MARFIWSTNFSKSSAFAYFSILKKVSRGNTKISVANFSVPNRPSYSIAESPYMQGLSKKRSLIFARIALTCSISAFL